MKKVVKIIVILVLVSVFTLSFFACKKKTDYEVPDNINKTSEGTPVLKIFNTATKAIEEMNIEDYLLGVVAGEMSNNWEIEALKAQAILARTYALNFVENNKSRYSGADLSTDITEAQAYNTSEINDRIKQAVSETSGKVVLNNNRLIEGWFHANSGGKTALASSGFNYRDEEPAFVKSVDSPENSSNSDNYTWSATLKKTDVLEALRKMGVSVQSASSFVVGETGECGRATSLVIGGKEVSATTFRLNIGSTIMKSTWITKINVYATTIYIEGRGFGHGVGMSQWGARVLAQQGKTAEEIIKYYFKDVEIGTAY